MSTGKTTIIANIIRREAIFLLCVNGPVTGTGPGHTSVPPANPLLTGRDGRSLNSSDDGVGNKILQNSLFSPEVQQDIVDISCLVFVLTKFKI